ncbi:hypothetical protein LP420_20610 [Massilia sp. B-10]|nr:hypothetical protein LP420_20610 [Massilia sp. B-10]
MPVDLAAIVAEESSRVGAAFEADALTVAGDARLLRRLLRNLLENAKRYGADTRVAVTLARARMARCCSKCAMADRAYPKPSASASLNRSTACRARAKRPAASGWG